jgi:enoyl-CoA hydratase
MENVIYERQDEVGVITLNRPEKLNALTEDMFRRLIDLFRAAGDDEKVKVIILKGAGRAFCGGTDISDLGKHRSIGEHRKTRLQDIQGLPRVLMATGKPTIAAIQGYAAGAGLEISLCCDIRIAAEDAKLGVPEVLRGATVLAGCTYLLPRIVGIGKAKEIILTGEFTGAREAERIGLVNKVVPLTDLDKEGMAMAQKFIRCSPFSIQLMRSCIDFGLDSSLEAALEAEANASCLSVASGEREEMALRDRKKK